MSDVLAAHAWPTNGHLIADVAKLGYLDGSVLDATYGEGTFWKLWTPAVLVTNDRYKPAMFDDDYTAMHWRDNRFDAVVFDPPYRLNGTPTLEAFDDRYGLGPKMSLSDRLDDICVGAIECFRVTSRHLLVKCQAQVCSGRVQWQDDLITNTLVSIGATKVDRFDMITTPRPQPDGRRQVHARHNASTLLVFRKET